MQNRSTFSGPRPATRAPRKISPINAAQRAGYMLDAEPPTRAAPSTHKGNAATATQSASAKPH